MVSTHMYVFLSSIGSIDPNYYHMLEETCSSFWWYHNYTHNPTQSTEEVMRRNSENMASRIWAIYDFLGTILQIMIKKNCPSRIS